ncbi:hypothetical protein GeomeDRAFT_1844 [Geobacter metallireducens RCH3]|nr:hypothetical protein [Geobacter metallireducens]EHP86538.1 hypothetical protein GeomeDRAFT_1844 [Geobacter metallireducens RCH3]
MEKKRFMVRLVRPVFEYVDIEVEAGEENEAVSAALAGAETIPADEWRGNFAAEEYGVDAVCVTESAGDDKEIFTEIAGEKKYLLLKADTDSGEGEVVYQPWIGEVSDLMLADLCSDWSGELAEAEEAGVAHYYDWAERYARFLKDGPAKVIQLRRPRGEDE